MCVTARAAVTARVIGTPGASAPRLQVAQFLADLVKPKDDALLCWPSLETISANTLLCRRTVQRALLWLHESRIILVKDPGNGKRSGTYFVAAAQQNDEKPPEPKGDRESPLPIETGQRVIFEPPKVTESHPPGDSESPVKDKDLTLGVEGNRQERPRDEHAAPSLDARRVEEIALTAGLRNGNVAIQREAFLSSEGDPADEASWREWCEAWVIQAREDMAKRLRAAPPSEKKKRAPSPKQSLEKAHPDWIDNPSLILECPKRRAKLDPRMQDGDDIADAQAWIDDCIANGRKYADWDRAWTKRCAGWWKFTGRDLDRDRRKAGGLHPAPSQGRYSLVDAGLELLRELQDAEQGR